MSPRALDARSVALGVLVAFGVVTAACGSSARGGSAGGGTAAPSTDGGATGGVPPTSTDGGTTTGGTDGGTASGGGAGPSGGASDGGSGSAGAGATCAELTATPGQGIDLRFDTGTHSSCALGTSDPDGQVDLGIRGGSFSTETVFDLYSPDGSAQRGSIALIAPNNRIDIDPWFHPTATGYAGIVHEPPPPLAFRTWSSTGVVLATGRDLAVSSAPDGHGGSVGLAQPFDPNATPSVGPTELQWIDASGLVSRSVVLDDSPDLVEVAWNTGHVLTIISGPTRARARWFDGAGTALTPWFDAGAAVDAGGASIHLLVDGSVALSDGQSWQAVFRDGVAQPDPPPDWLASRPGTRLATIRQGRGYAVLPSPTPQADQTAFEIVSASGESCGMVSIPAAPAIAGADRQPIRLDVGQDGTVFQTELVVGQNLGSGIHCGFRWWPGLLK